MNFFFKAKKEAKQQPSNPLHNVMNNLQTHFTNFLRIPNNPFHSKRDHDPDPSQNGAPAPPWARIADQFSNNINETAFPSSSSDSSSSSNNGGAPSNIDLEDDDPFCKKSLSIEEIKRRFSRTPVYRTGMVNCRKGCVSVKSPFAKRHTMFYFFSEQDGKDFVPGLLVTEEIINDCGGVLPIDVSLDEIIDPLRGTPPARLVPDVSQVKNALKERNKAGFHGDTFSGVPVFQSDGLTLRVDKDSLKRDSVAFFKKEDLETALRIEKGLNYADIEREIIQVTALEDIIREMKDCSTSKWNNVVFIPPEWNDLITREN